MKEPYSGDRNDDHVDCALTFLPKDVVDGLGAAVFIQEDKISRFEGSPEGREYTRMGFPNSKNKTIPHRPTEFTVTMLAHAGIGLSRDLLPSVANETDHILVDFDPKHSRDPRGGKMNAIGFKGCRGGLIVDLGPLWSPAGVDRIPAPLPIAMMIEMHRDSRVVIGTRLEQILSVLRTVDSEHRDCPKLADLPCDDQTGRS